MRPVDSHLLAEAAERAARYLQRLPDRPVPADPAAVAQLSRFHEPLPYASTDPAKVIRRLDEWGSPATNATAGGRFFGFVIGGSLPVTVAAQWLAAAWDQNVGLWAGSPVGTVLEEVALDWLVDLLGLPSGTGGAFVTGATVANLTALAAARHALLAAEGWDVEERGLYGAPELGVVVSEEAHPTVLKALAVLGLGRARVTPVPCDGQGRMRTDALPEIDGPAIVCLQAGNVNTGAFDPLETLVPWAKARGAWVHVDGAFGLWAAASEDKRALVAGVEEADSWATDAHKWLNVPYDSGLAFVRDPEPLKAAMRVGAAYLPETEHREPSNYTPELSRRARGVEVWAALRTLGRSGVADLVDRLCAHARRMARELRAAGAEILNDVVLNQVLVSFGDAERNGRVIRRIQAEGTCWCGGTTWQGRSAMRISVCSHATDDDDVTRSLEAIREAAWPLPAGAK